MPDIEVYPHVKLRNLAEYQFEIIQKKEESNNKTLDCIACLISLAFYVEALINAAGYEVYDGGLTKKGDELPFVCTQKCQFEEWENYGYYQKLKSLLPSDQYQEIQESLDGLRQFRNASSHAKVSNNTTDPSISIEQSHESLWEQSATLESVKQTSQNIDRFRSILEDGFDQKLTVTSPFMPESIGFSHSL